MTDRLFKRVVKVEVDTLDVGSFDTATEVKRTTIEHLRVKFAIERHLGKKPNTANVTIFNLKETNRAELMRKPLRLKLFAGYEGSLDLIFSGDLVWGESHNPGVTWETNLQLGDGQRAYKHARASRSFKAGTTVGTAVKDLAAAMGLKVPSNVGEATAFVKQFATGVTLTEPAPVEMSRLMGAAGYGWSMQNGRLQVLRGSDANNIIAHRVAQDTGMIGIPEFGPPAKAKGKPVLKVMMKLAAQIGPGDPISMDSKSIKGLYKVQRINHQGDTGDNSQEWHSALEAVAVG